jgi:hypothetical protein
MNELYKEIQNLCVNPEIEFSVLIARFLSMSIIAQFFSMSIKLVLEKFMLTRIHF